jgi:hypothetical protein
MADDPFEGTDPLLAARLRKMIADSGGRLWVVSGFRSVERQQQLWDQAVKKYGSEAAARKWVARPGTSNHNKGRAVDMGGTDEGMSWMKANLGRYGLWQPMDHEPWHIELPKNAVEFEPDAYTEPPVGGTPVGDPRDPAFQMMQFVGILDMDMHGELTGAGDGVDIAASQSGGIDLSPGQGNINLPSDPRMADFGYQDPPDITQDDDVPMQEVLDGNQ